MSYFHTEYRKFLANPRSAKVAANLTLIYVPSTTRFDGSDAVLTHLTKQTAIVKKNAENIINAIEASDSLVLDVETTLEFLEGGGAYLPSLSDNFLADRVVTIPTLHIVRWNAENEIQQVRIYWDQGSLLKEVEIIGARSRAWPIRSGQEQTRLLRSAANAQSAPPPTAQFQNSQKELPARPGSPGKRHIRDPYGAGSLTDLLSPNKTAAEHEQREYVPRPASPGKKHAKDPYATGSLTELLSPSKAAPAPINPYAPSASRPPPRDLSDIFIDEEAPSTPSKPERIIAPKGAARYHENDMEYNLDQDRAAYKSNPKRFNHFELGADDADLEVNARKTAAKSGAGETEDSSNLYNLDQSRAAYKSNPKRFNHFEIGDDSADAEVAQKVPAAKSGAGQTQQDSNQYNLDQSRAAYKSNPKRFNHFEIGDDSADAEVAQKVPAAKTGAGQTQQDSNQYNLDQSRAAYKSNPKRFNHFEIGDDSADAEVAQKVPAAKTGAGQSQENRTTQENIDPSRAPCQVHKGRFDHFEIGDQATPQKPGAKKPPVEHVNKPRRDADVHFDINEHSEEEGGRIISSFGGRGQGLYKNTLFSGQDEESSAPLSQLANNTNRQKNSDVHWTMSGLSPAPKSDVEHAPENHDKAVKMMESSWDNYDESPEPVRTATALKNPTRHNQPSWTFGQ
ncbi:hypothetical protein N7466_003087 [Penicillium verhagenii]|uniref:uncharacterized protein n=1 Tax=Penicillium verhagenii TaxID=1562060 RepID=UPI00254533CF|nr:uncharacterized protein N7466_003087 [Penicillium verhagenii]KAJ5936637.1 hypothetical protein N7466_003087 [Penicillium verhagenii]